MKKILLTLSFALAAAGLMAQSCTPDDNITTPGTYPSILPDGTAGTNYSQVIQFRVPADTNVLIGGGSVYAVIDSIKVVNVQGLPGGLNYACNPSSCALPGGKTSCSIISGTIDAQAQGTHPFTIPVIIYVRIGGSIPTQQPDTIFNLGMNVNAPTSTTKVIDDQLVVYPNPSAGNLNIALTFHAGQAEVQLFDRQGKAIKVDMDRENNVIELNTGNLAPGMYYGVVRRGDSVYRFHFIRN